MREDVPAGGGEEEGRERREDKFSWVRVVGLGAGEASIT
jgi:hypothetical protein